tara:strand:- start:4798 stop:5973 length:1176 start_codon:yes stop_codon:yes gene_type:complete
MFTTILAMIFVLGVLVFIHELGHFIAARSIGVKVEEFSVGFPPKLISFTPSESGIIFKFYFFGKDEKGKIKWKSIFESKINSKKYSTSTEYSLSIIPLGGYVKVAGFIDESFDSNVTGASDELNSKTKLQQIWFMSGGIIMNILLAIIFFSGITMIQGISVQNDEPIIREVSIGYPADLAGIKSGDRILEVENVSIDKWSEATTIIKENVDGDIQIKWISDEVIKNALIPTKEAKVPDGNEIKEVRIIGVQGGFEIRKANFFESIYSGFDRTIFWLKMIVQSLAMIFSGNASFNDIGGPILIAQLAGDSARAGIISLLSFTAIISVNLAFMNLLPIPGLDGGHILLTSVEFITRRSISTKVKMFIQQIGVALLLLLMALVMFNDISRLLTG